MRALLVEFSKKRVSEFLRAVPITI
jgi:hypothetical protein